MSAGCLPSAAVRCDRPSYSVACWLKYCNNLGALLRKPVISDAISISPAASARHCADRESLCDTRDCVTGQRVNLACYVDAGPADAFDWFVVSCLYWRIWSQFTYCTSAINLVRYETIGMHALPFEILYRFTDYGSWMLTRLSPQWVTFNTSTKTVSLWTNDDVTSRGIYDYYDTIVELLLPFDTRLIIK